MPDEPEMSEAQIKVFENRLRRMAKRQGLSLIKSRRRDPRANGYGGWMIAEDRMVVAGGHPEFHLSIDDVEAYLTD